MAAVTPAAFSVAPAVVAMSVFTCWLFNY
jgi:hypothetical protein